MVAKSENNSKPLGLHPLFARYAENAGDVKAGDDLEKMGLTEAYQVQVYRLEPSTYTGGPEFLRTFNEVPDEKTLKHLFGGGRYLLKLFQNGRFQPGPASLRIAGEPRVDVQEDTDTSGSESVVSGSSEGVLFGILERKMQGLETKLDDMLRSVGAASGGSDSLSPERLGRLIDVANAKRLETRLLESSLGTSGPPPVHVAPATVPTPSVDMLDMMLKVFRAGVDFAGSSGDGNTDDLVSRGLSHLLDLFSKATGKTVPGSAVVPARPSAAPDAPAGKTPDPEEIELQRRAVEKDLTERNAASIVERLQRAIGVMLEAFSAEPSYTTEEVCSFVKRILPPDTIDRLGGKLTFANVRELMADVPETQMELDTYRDGVENVLSLLRAPEGGTSVSNGND